VGRHIPDFVSFPERIAIELVNAGETEVIVSDRANRKTWLEERGYRVIAISADDVTRDIAPQLDRLEALLASGMPGQG
jgi:tRNA/rRNA methyltransferase